MSPHVEQAEVLVVGAGPAGSALSAVLARRGRDVLLMDRSSFPRQKPCGECVNPGGVRALSRLEFQRAVRATRPVSLVGWSLASPEGVRAWAPFPSALVGWGVDRGTFDSALLNEAREAGARVIEGAHVVRVSPGSATHLAEAQGTGPDGEDLRVRAQILVGADGLRSVTARQVGLVRRSPRLRKASLTWRVRGTGPASDRGHLLLGGDLTVGLAPVPSHESGDQRWNATLVVSRGSTRTSLRSSAWTLLVRAMEHLTGSWEEGPEVCDGPWASGPFDRPVSRVRRDRVLLVGDASGYYDPLTGQGIFRALRGAEIAAEAIDAALDRKGSLGIREQALEAYAGTLARAFRGGERTQHVIEGVLCRPALREPLLSLLGRSVKVSSLLARVVGDVGAVL